MPVDLETIRAGDRVRLTPRSRTFNAPAGTICTVQDPPTILSFNRRDVWLQVTFDPGDHVQGNGGYDAIDFDLIPVVNPGEVIPLPPMGVTPDQWMETLRFEMERRRRNAFREAGAAFMRALDQQHVRVHDEVLITVREPELLVDDEEVKTIWY